MWRIMRVRHFLALGLLVWPAGAAAQIDYRNLDDDRPTFVEDAYPIERFAFELLAPWRYERGRGGAGTHLFVPELAHGVLPNLQVGLKLPIAAIENGMETTWGLAGVRAFALYNFANESRSLPALSLRADAALPVGGLGGEATRVGLEAIATRSFGAQRLHVNAAVSAGGAGDPSAGEPLARWSLGAAIDRTFIRQSLLVVVEAYAVRHHADEPTEVLASLGGRIQVTPTLVVDAGVGRRLSRHGPNLSLTLGVSHAFAVPWLMPSPRRERPAR